MTILKVGKSIFRMSVEKALSIARPGDIIQLAPGKYKLNTVINNAITFEAEQADGAVVLTGLLVINNTSCIFKKIEFECSVSNDSLIVAKQSHLMFEHCYFYGTKVTLATAILLTSSSLTAYYCSFSGISSNAIRATDASKIIIYNSVFKDLKDSSAIYLNSSQLNIKDTCFIDIATNTINAIGESHIKTLDCEWQVSKAPALYLNPKVTAEIIGCIFKSNSTAIFAQQASLTLKSCDFMNIDDSNVINIKPSATINHLFKGMEHSSVIEIEDSHLHLQDSRFIAIPIHAIESIGHSHITARDCLWQIHNMPVLYLHPEGTAEITNSIFKGSNAMICVQQASLTLKSCEFIDITFSTPIKATQNSQIIINRCGFKNIQNFNAINAETNCSVKITESHFNGKVLTDELSIYINAEELAAKSSIDSEIDSGDLWFLNNDTVEKLQANFDRQYNFVNDGWDQKTDLDLANKIEGAIPYKK